MSSETSPTQAPRPIEHNTAARRFEYRQDGLLCVLDYTLDGTVASFTHTGVPPALEGRGIAADLVRAGLTTARQRGWRVRPLCSYVAAFMQRHPEFQDLLA